MSLTRHRLWLLRQQMGLNKCLCARKALQSLSWVDDDFSHMQESMAFQGWEKLPWEEPQRAASFCGQRSCRIHWGGRKGGSHPSSVEKQGSGRVSSCLLPAHGVCLHPPPPHPAAPVHPSTPGWECSRLGELLQNPGQDTEREMEGLKFDNC